MPHSFPVPDTDVIEGLITQAYEYLPAPDKTQLNRVEVQLNRVLGTRKLVRKPNRIPWWVVLILAGGFTSAAWWAGEQWFADKEINPEVAEPEITQPADESLLIPEAPERREADDVEDSYYEKDSPVIYQRETY